MGKYTSCLFIRTLFVLLLAFALFPKELMKIKGEYIIFSRDQKYIYGGGKVEILAGGKIINGDRVYFDLNTWKGIVSGKAVIDEENYDLLVFRFKDGKFSYEGMRFEKKIVKKGKEIIPPRLISPVELRKASVYFEAKEMEVSDKGKIVGKIVIPYVLGAPSIPMKSLLLSMGKPPDKTNLRPGRIRYSKEEGAFLGVVLNLREKLYQGSYELQYFERELFKIPGDKRGIIFSGSGSFGKKGKKPIIENSIFYTTSGKNLDFTFLTSKQGKSFDFYISQRGTTNEAQKPYYWLSSGLKFKKLNFFMPGLEVGWNYCGSYSLNLYSEIHPLKKLSLDLSWAEKNVKGEGLTTKTRTSSARLSYTPSIFTLEAVGNISNDLIQETERKDLTMNLRFPALKFLEDSVSAQLEGFFLFSSFPYGNSRETKYSPGFRFSLDSSGFSLPLGFEFSPNFSVNQVWERGKTSWSEFNYFLDLQKKIWVFVFGGDFTLSSRYKTGGFWVEGYNNFYLKGKIGINSGRTSFFVYFYYNKEFFLERATTSGEIYLPLNFRVRLFSVYNNYTGEISTLEAYLEKDIRHAIRLQLGYSLALKKYFFRVIPL